MHKHQKTSLESVLARKTTTQPIVPEVVVPRESSTPQFGKNPGDYIFITPPDDYWQNNYTGLQGRGHPMPNRSKVVDSSGHSEQQIISWEDPIYLQEWIYTLSYLCSGRQYSISQFQKSVLQKDRKIDIARFNQSLSVSGKYLKGTRDVSIGGDLAYYGIGSITDWLEPEAYFWAFGYQYVLWKRSAYNPKTTVEIFNGNPMNNGNIYYMVGFIAAKNVSPSYEEIISKVVEVTTASPAIQSVISNLLPSPSPNTWDLKKQIPLSIYFVLQSVANSVFLSTEYGVVSHKGSQKTWQVSVSRTCTQEPEAPEWQEDWSPPATDYNDGNKPSVSVTMKKAGKNSEHSPAANPGSSINPITSEYTTDNGTDILKITKNESSSISWSSVEGYWTTPSVEVTEWNDSEGRWSSEYTTSKSYVVYTTSGLDRGSRGEYKKASEFKFYLDASRIVKYHTADGSERANCDFLKALNFFVSMDITVGNNIQQTGSGYTEGYPQYSGFDGTNVLFAYGVYKVIVPLTGEEVSHESESHTRTGAIYSIWKIKDIDGLIGKAFQNLQLQSIVSQYGNVPQSLDDIKTAASSFPASENTRYTSTTEHDKCKGSWIESFQMNISVSISGITGAFLWTPWPSVGMTDITPTDFE